MKKIKVLVEYRKEDFEDKLANFISNGFNLLQSNITYANNPISTKNDMIYPYQLESKNAQYHIIYFAILMKED